MTQTAISSFDTAGFDAFIESRSEPDWLIQTRREAWGHAEAMQWPERREEEWIRTDIRTFQINKFGAPCPGEPDATSSASEFHQLREGVEVAGLIETMDSQIVSESLDESLAAKGVVFGSLERLCETHGDLIREHLFTNFDADYDKFAALHAAFWSGGQFLYCLLYTSPSPRDRTRSRMPSSA